MCCSIGWAPEFVLKRYVLTGIRDGPQEPAIADSIDFVVSQVCCFQPYESCPNIYSKANWFNKVEGGVFINDEIAPEKGFYGVISSESCLYTVTWKGS